MRINWEVVKPSLWTGAGGVVVGSRPSITCSKTARAMKISELLTSSAADPNHKLRQPGAA
jgi:hypothetical protein